MNIIPSEIMYEDIILTFALIIYTFIVVYLTKYAFSYMRNRGIEKKDALYYNRKFVHIFAGGIVALFIPLYSSEWYPLLAGVLFTIITYISHKRGSRLYWFQSPNDKNDVNFCLMWGLGIFVLWNLLGNPWLAIIPAAFIAFGDGITGIVRNAMFKQRSKHPIGNVFMAAVCIPLGFMFGSMGGIALGGAIVGLLASIVERFEKGPIDDNIIITVVSAAFLYFYIVVFPIK